MKIISIVGARPQFIKLAPLSKKLRQCFKEIIIHTGQHYNLNMSAKFFDDLNIPKPDYDLSVGSDNHGKQTGEMLSKIEKVLVKEKPSIVIVFGDANSTLAGALAAVKLGVQVIHVEAGLRSYNRLMPEEINRILTDHASDYLFAPTKTAMINLANEGLRKRSYLSGDIMVDVLLANVNKAKSISSVLKNLTLNSQEYYLLTLHRPHNVDDPLNLNKILSSLSQLDEKIVFPIHPRTQEVLEQNGIKLSSNIKLVKPQGYIDFISLESNAKKIITDSGGIQKEAFILNKPCITLRSETEWVETIESGWNCLISPQSPDIIEKIRSFNPPAYKPEIFGKDVSIKMFELIKQFLGS